MISFFESGLDKLFFCHIGVMVDPLFVVVIIHVVNFNLFKIFIENISSMGRFFWAVEFIKVHDILVKTVGMQFIPFWLGIAASYGA